MVITKKKSAKKRSLPAGKAGASGRKLTKTKSTKAKKPQKKAAKPKKKVEPAMKYYEAVGRRKRATARVRLFTCRPFEDEKARISVNEKSYTDFFPTLQLQEIVASPLQKMKSVNRFKITVKVKGGGIRGQAEAIRHGLTRTLVKFNPDFSKKLKRAGFLRRDPREKERKKPGLKKARRAPQWRKR